MTHIEVPCSSGPGFDVVGLSLSILLELQVMVDISVAKSSAPLNCVLTYEGDGADHVPLGADANLITRTMLYVLKCHDQRTFPCETRVHIINPIPLGRRFGSSGAAVVGKLGLSQDRMLDFCPMIERHPDNVTAAMIRGFLDPVDMERKEIPLAEVLPEPAGGIDTGLKPPQLPMEIGHYVRFGWAKEIKAITITPNFEVSTASARAIFNLQRLTALARSPPDAELTFQAMQDKVHQPYRKTLIPGLPDIPASVTPQSHPGLLGICLSGAEPCYPQLR
ncbi:hypothetical protein BDZ91DRAFT_745975 [Kalaharituber pfeilii]|nr:hypothetical protein BDZ91DRAFT_745975 [Kalaharituber pfeilii]